MSFYFRNTEKDIIMTEKDEKVYRNISNCSFIEKEILCDEVRDHCQLTNK